MTDSILVIGAGGFIGRHLVRALAQRGESVIAASRHGVEFGADNVELVVAELREPEDLLPLLARSRRVVHLASKSTPGSSAKSPLGELEENLRPTLALLEALQSHRDCQLLYLSSGGTLYGDAFSEPVSERSDVRPKSYHGAGKAAAELFIGAWCSQSAAAATVLRPSNVYGPGQTERSGFGIVPAAFGRILRQETLTVWGDGSAVRDYLFVDDFIDLCLSILAAPMPTGMRTFNAASGAGASLNELLDKIETVSGRRLSRAHDTARAVDVERIVIDADLARQTFTWTPSTGLIEGLERTWNWFSTTQR